MYQFKKKIKINITEASKRIGVSRPHLSKVLNHKINCSKTLAYCIVKYINKDAELSDYFKEV